MTPTSATLVHATLMTETEREAYETAATDDLTRLAHAVAASVRRYVDHDDALNAAVWAELGLSLRDRAGLLHTLLPHAETEADVRRATSADDLLRLTGYEWDGDWSQQHADALAHAEADTVAQCIAAVREVLG